MVTGDHSFPGCIDKDGEYFVTAGSKGKQIKIQRKI
jgi:hypothetical protein